MMCECACVCVWRICRGERRSYDVASLPKVPREAWRSCLTLQNHRRRRGRKGRWLIVSRGQSVTPSLDVTSSDSSLKSTNRRLQNKFITTGLVQFKAWKHLAFLDKVQLTVSLCCCCCCCCWCWHHPSTFFPCCPSVPCFPSSPCCPCRDTHTATAGSRLCLSMCGCICRFVRAYTRVCVRSVA